MRCDNVDSEKFCHLKFILLLLPSSSDESNDKWVHVFFGLSLLKVVKWIPLSSSDLDLVP